MAATATKQITFNTGDMVCIADNLVPQPFVFSTYDSKALSTAAILGNFASQTIVNLKGGTATTFYYASSDNAQDKAGGTGALTMRCHGFTTAGIYQYEDITLTGTTKVTGSLSFGYNPIYLEVLTTGTGLNPEGNLLVGNSGHTEIYGVIPAGVNQSSILHLDIPPNVIGFYDMTLTATIATTAGDGLYVMHYKDTHGTNVVPFEVQRATITAAVATMSPMEKMRGIMAPGYSHRWYGEDIGTTAQTLAWTMTWGFRYI